MANLQSSLVHVQEGLGTRLVALGYFSLDPGMINLVPRPSPAPVFDHLQYAKLEPEKAWEQG